MTRSECSSLFRDPDCWRSPATKLSATKVPEQRRDTNSFLRQPSPYDFSSWTAISHSRRIDETVTGIVLVESLNGSVEGTGKLPSTIFHSAKSPKLHSIPDCSTCSKFSAVTLRIRPIFPTTTLLALPCRRVNIRKTLKCNIAARVCTDSLMKTFIAARSRRFLQTCSLLRRSEPVGKLWLTRWG